MEAVELLEQWMQWAWRCRIDAFVRLGNTIANHITREHRLSNAFSRRSTPASACSPVAP